MFCPKCGQQNIEPLKFCRSCGVNLHLVPKALSGALTKNQLNIVTSVLGIGIGMQSLASSLPRGEFPLLSLGILLLALFWLGVSLKRDLQRSTKPAPKLSAPPVQTKPVTLSFVNSDANIEPPTVTESTTKRLDEN